MFDFDYIIGDEAVDFQVNSKLGKSLTSIFREVQEFKDTLDYSRVPNIDESRRTYRIDKVCEFVKNTTMKKFAKVVLDCCNLEIKNIICFGGDTYGLTGSYAVNIDISDIGAGMYEIVSRQSGSSDYVSGKTKDYIDDIASMSESFDAFNSTLKNRVFGKAKEPIFVGKVYFDINMAFLADEYVSENVVKPMEPEEVAAIMMHEIGHAMSTIEHAGDMYFMHSRLKEIQVNLKNKELSEKEALEVINDIDKKLISKLRVSLNDTEGINSAIKKKLLTLVDTCSMAIRNLNRDDDSASGTTLLGNLLRAGLLGVWAIISIILNVYISIISLLCGITIWNELFNRTSKARNAVGEKLSDVGANHNRDFVIERWADEFVSRHGYGQWLASALNKFETMVYHSYDGSIALRENCVWQMMTSVAVAISKFVNIITWFDPAIYEDQYHRLYRVAQNTYAFFKSADRIPKDIVLDWMDKIKAIEDEVNVAKRLRDTKAGTACVNIFKSLTNPVKWYAYIHDGNIDQDLQLLEDNLDDMLNNKLFYLSSKLSLR